MDVDTLRSRLKSELEKEPEDINVDLVKQLKEAIKAGGKPDKIEQTGISLPANFDPDIDVSGPPHLVNIPSTPQRLIRILKHMGWNARYNVLKDKQEWHHDELQPDWGVPPDDIIDAIPAHIMDQYVMQKGRGTVPVTCTAHWKSIMSMYATSNTINEPKEWLDSITPMDGGDALLELIAEGLSLHTQSDDEEYRRWVVELMIGSLISRIYEPGCHLRVVPIIYGEQNMGKGLWVSRILPPELEQYFVTGFRFQRHTKDMVDQMMGSVLLELSELHGKNATEVEAIKAYIGPGTDTVRLSYGRRARQIKKTGSIIATANPGNDLPKDESGNTRWIPITMLKDVTAWINNHWPELREETFAHVLYLYEQGKRWNDIPSHLRSAQTEDIEAHTYLDPVIDSKICNWLKDEMSKPAWANSDEVITSNFLITDVLGLEPQHPRSNINRDLAIVMQARGFVRSRPMVDGVRVWGWRYRQPNDDD